jgi:hypothetical protein
MSNEPGQDRWQFGLAALLGVVLLCAVGLGLFVNASTEHRVSFRCQVLPVEDQQLEDWFERQDGIQNVAITRSANTVQVSFSRRGLRWSNSLIQPPLAGFGYSGMQRMSWSMENRGRLYQLALAGAAGRLDRDRSARG